MFGKAQVVGWVATPVRMANSANPIANFCVSFYTGKKQDDGYKQTFMLSCNAFGDMANMANTYLQKGDLVYVEGYLGFSNYTDKNGIDRQSTQLNVGFFRSLQSKNPQSAGTKPQPQQVKKQPANARSKDIYHYDEVGEIPF